MYLRWRSPGRLASLPGLRWAWLSCAQAPSTLGHAWAELQISGNWTVADATLAETVPVRHLPLAILQNEG